MGLPENSGIASSLPTPSCINEDLFRVSEPLKKLDTLGLRDVLKEPKWPQIVRAEFLVKAAEQSALFHMVDTDTVDAADHYWHSSLLPRGQLVECVATHDVCFVSNVCDGAAGALVCPFLPCGTYFKPCRLKRLESIHVDDISEWKVMPTRTVSPSE